MMLLVALQQTITGPGPDPRGDCYYPPIFEVPDEVVEPTRPQFHIRVDEGHQRCCDRYQSRVACNRRALVGVVADQLCPVPFTQRCDLGGVLGGVVDHNDGEITERAEAPGETVCVVVGGDHHRYVSQIMVGDRSNDGMNDARVEQTTCQSPGLVSVGQGFAVQPRPDDPGAGVRESNDAQRRTTDEQNVHCHGDQVPCRRRGGSRPVAALSQAVSRRPGSPPSHRSADRPEAYRCFGLEVKQ